MEFIEAFLGTYWGKLLTVFFAAMTPVMELRGAIPIASAAGIDLWLALIVSIIGNMVPVPFIILFIRKIFDWMRRINARFDRLVSRMEQKAEKHRKLVERSKFWGLCILVAIPLPGTGAWTGALVAAVLEMRLKDAVPAIFLGVVGAGIIVAIVTLITSGVFSMVF